jgi:hypothetical protein
MNPLDPLMPVARNGSALAHIPCGHRREALALAEQALQDSPKLRPALRAFAASSALAGRMDQAKSAITRLRQVDPALRVSNFRDLTPLRRPEDIAVYDEAIDPEAERSSQAALSAPVRTAYHLRARSLDASNLDTAGRLSC